MFAYFFTKPTIMKSYFTILIFFFTILTLAGQNIPIDFEPGGNGGDWTWTVFENQSNPALEIIANPDPSGINTSATVAKFTALADGAPFAGCESLHGAGIGSFTIDNSNAIIRIMVWKSVISDVGIKLVTSSSWSKGELKVANTKVNEWEQLTFDFSTVNHENMTYDQIVIFPDFANRQSDNIIYFDAIYGEEAEPTSTFNLSDFGLKLFPNPANKTLSLQADEPIDQYEIYSITGALVASDKRIANETTIDIADLTNGIYLLKAISDDQTIIEKFVKE